MPACSTGPVSTQPDSGLAEVCREAVETAREMGISVSYDINYRKNLWKYGKTAQEVLRPLIASSDIMFGSEANMPCSSDSSSGIQGHKRSRPV